MCFGIRGLITWYVKALEDFTVEECGWRMSVSVNEMAGVIMEG
jgi:hypothetical protein